MLVQYKTIYEQFVLLHLITCFFKDGIFNENAALKQHISFPMASYVLSHAVMSLQTPGSVPLAKRREDEVSVGSTPLAKQPSNQASDYASSPVKTKTVTGRFTKPQLKILL